MLLTSVVHLTSAIPSRHRGPTVMKRSLALAWLALAALVAVPAARADGTYRVGPGDIIEVRVRADESLTQTPTVQPSGVIVLAGVGEVPAAERTLEEIRFDLERRLGASAGTDGVAVSVKEYRSRFVTVLGEVGRPGRVPLRGQTRLVDALVEAGGFTASASLELTIQRFDGSFPDGTRTRRVQVEASAVPGPGLTDLELALRPRDLVIATPRTFFAVQGEVARPGRYRIDPGLTVTAALERAGGLTRYARHGLKLHRVNPTTGGRDILSVDLEAIRRGSQPDLPLKSEDVISVHSR